MNRIKQLRELNRMNQKELAAFLNISQGSLSNWERGIHDPDNEALILLSQKFNVTTDYLLGKSNTPSNVYTAQNIQNSSLVQGNGNILNSSINNTGEFSVDESEIIRIFRLLDAKQRHKLMSIVFDMEEQAIKAEMADNDNN